MGYEEKLYKEYWFKLVLFWCFSGTFTNFWMFSKLIPIAPAAILKFILMTKEEYQGNPHLLIHFIYY